MIRISLSGIQSPPKKPLGKNEFKWYIARLTRNRAINILKSRTNLKRNLTGEIAIVLGELNECIGENNPEKKLLENEILQAINTFLKTLPQKSRVLFVERYYYAESVKNIATKYCLTENRVSVTLFRTRKQLFKYLILEGYIDE